MSTQNGYGEADDMCCEWLTCHKGYTAMQERVNVSNNSTHMGLTDAKAML